MTDMALPAFRPLDVASDEARARVKARYRAERRFQFYGIAAIGLTAAFLVVVLVDILVKGLPAFTQYRLVMDVTVDKAEIDPQGSNDPTVLRGGDYQLLVRNALRAQFPDVTQRAPRRLLDGMLSSGAGDVLRERVVADPALVGQTARVPVLLSDDVDLYLKGVGTKIVTRSGTGTITPSGTTGEVTLLTSSNQFSEELVRLRRLLFEKSRELGKEAERLQRAVRYVQGSKADLERLKAIPGTDPKAVARLDQRVEGAEAEIQSLAQRARELETEAAAMQARFDSAGGSEPLDERLPSLLVAVNNGVVKIKEVSGSQARGDVVVPLASTAEAGPGTWRILNYTTPESNRRVTDLEVTWLELLRERGLLERAFNWSFFTSGDSREPELAGIRGALIGSFLTLLVTLVLCLPTGVAAAIYLEEFAPKNRLTEIIEVNINNLAAVPSIVFGLLGLAVFLNFLGLPRSAPLVGGLVLALLVLPTIIIASRAALRAVPPSIREAALGVGASHQQAIFHHILPLAMPGIMTGTIIGMAHALGETAPLLLIGMVAFIVEVPQGLTSAATVLPVQIYLWSDLPEIAFQAKTAAAIIVLLVFLFMMNGAAIVLRRRFERRW
jgi:phosphate transport system permease protein